MRDHFREATKMVPLGSGARRSVKDYMLIRYACYLLTTAYPVNHPHRREDLPKEYHQYLSKQRTRF